MSTPLFRDKPSKVEKKLRQILAGTKGVMADNGIIFDEDIKKLKALHNIHKGKKAFLIGNGPSVRTEDLERLTDGITFCFNRFYMAYDMTTFRPDYTLASDRQTIADFGPEIVAQSAGQILIASVVRPKFVGDFIWLCHQKKGLFSSVYGGIVPGGGTLVVAMQIAWHLGIRDFVLYGVDHHYPVQNNTGSKDLFYSASGEGNHFIPNYRSGKPWCPQSTDSIEESFRYCRQFIEQNNGSVINATRGGKLEIFERAPIENYF